MLRARLHQNHPGRPCGDKEEKPPNSARGISASAFSSLKWEILLPGSHSLFLELVGTSLFEIALELRG